MSDDCGCCSSAPATAPMRVGNRPGLNQIAYRSGTWAEFRASLHARLSASHGPLGKLRTREDDDPTIALLDAWAVACDVLTFYNERLVQESYLRTTSDPVSLQELGRLIGYLPAPGVAADTYLAFSLERPPEIPTVSKDPGLAPPTTPSEVDLPIGLRVQSIPGPGEVPQTFETVEHVTGRPEWSSIPAALTVPHPPVWGRTTGWFKGTDLMLAKGSAILYTGQTPGTTDFDHDHWDVRLATDVLIDQALQATRVHYEWRLGSLTPDNAPAAQPAAYVLRKRLNLFGHNAPMWRAMHDSFRDGYSRAVRSDHSAASKDDPEWLDFVAVRPTADKYVQSVDIEGSHPDIVTGSWIVVSGEVTGSFYRELYEVTDRAELSLALYGVSGTVTRLTLHGEKHDFGTPRQATVFAVSEPLEITEAPNGSEVIGTSVVVDGDASAMKAGRMICVSDDAGAEVVAVDQAAAAGTTPVGTPRTQISFASALTRSYDRSKTVVLGNVVKATHGETVHDLLGSGDGRRRFPAFQLPQGPLTFVQAATAGGAASTLRVEVDGVAWDEVATQFGAGPSDRTFSHERSADLNPATGQAYDVVRFGDGVHGARVPTGTHNVRATYRKGLGARGNLPAGQVSQPLDRPLGLKAATNPVPATGGTDPENSDDSRRSMPVSTRTLGRAVSLADYADFSLAFAGISRADARVLALPGGRTVVVSVCGPNATPAPPSTLSHLQQALVDLGDPLVRVQVVPAEIARIRLALKVLVDPHHDSADVVAAVRSTLAASFIPATRDLADPLHASAVVAVTAGVPGVDAVDLDLLYRAGNLPSLQDHVYAELARIGPTGTVIGTELLGLADEPFDALAVMS